MKKISLLIILFLSLFSSAMAGGTSSPDHADWDRLLQRYVSQDGKVDYRGFDRDADFKNYLTTLSGIHPDDSWTRQEQMAYWINAYNAFTIKLVLDNLPLNSIKDIGEPWKMKFIRIEGKNYSLDDIEHGILRPEFKDARIHFAVNCASHGCPPIHRRAFKPATLDSQLDKVTRSFINDEQYNAVNGENLQLSRIFEWFSEDFASAGGVIDFFDKYYVGSVSDEATIVYTDYDWTLNAK